jgi:uncharacterized membrane protein
VKSLRKIILPLLVAFAPAKVLACAACYGGSIDSPMTDGMNWGILTLLAVLGVVLATALTLLIYFIRKSEALNAIAQKHNSPEATKA